MAELTLRPHGGKRSAKANEFVRCPFVSSYDQGGWHLVFCFEFSWGIDYVNSLLVRDDNSTSGNLGISGSGLGRRLFVQHDANYNVTSLTNTSGAELQRYVYTPYGVQTALTATWGAAGSPIAFTYTYQGMRLDPVVNLLHADERDYLPRTGTWIQKDPAGYVDGVNLFRAFESAPESRTDPLGLMPPPPPPPQPTVTVDAGASMGIHEQVTGTLENGAPTVSHGFQEFGGTTILWWTFGQEVRTDIAVVTQQVVRGNWEAFGPRRTNVSYFCENGVNKKKTEVVQDYQRDDAIRNVNVDVFITGHVDDTTLSKIDTAFNFTIGPFISPELSVLQATLESLYGDALTKISQTGEVKVTVSPWQLTEPEKRSEIISSSVEDAPCDKNKKQ